MREATLEDRRDDNSLDLPEYCAPFVEAHAGRVSCTAATECADNWPPLKLPSKNSRVVGGTRVAGTLRTVPSPSGGQQVTYDGWPLYRFVTTSRKATHVVTPGTDSGSSPPPTSRPPVERPRQLPVRPDRFLGDEFYCHPVLARSVRRSSGEVGSLTRRMEQSPCSRQLSNRPASAQ